MGRWKNNATDSGQLVARAQNGDRDAFRDLIRMLEPRIAATVIGMLGPCQEADDIGQETCIRLYHALNNFRGESRIDTYVTRIAINLSLNELKRRRRMTSIFHNDLQPESAPPYDGRDEFERQEIQAIVRAAIAKLSPRYRAVIVLRLLDGYSTRETAEILDVPEGTVLSRLARAQKKLKEILIPLMGAQS